MEKTIFITGGHVTPAIAVIEEIRKRKLPWRIVFVGRKQALEGEINASAEYNQISAMGIPFLTLMAGRLTRVLTTLSILSWLKIPFGFIQAFWYVASRRPRFIISFGGYLALPIVVAGTAFRVPTVTHEQTMQLGLANRIIGFFAKKIFVSFPTDKSQKIVVTGLPVRQELFHPPAKPSFAIPNKKRFLYITGGSTGASSLNEKLFPFIETLPATWCVIHQTGYHWERREPTDTYISAPYFQSSDVAWIYKHADLVICRAGANTVWELAALGKIALLVPLPWSASSEQLANARWLVAKGSATVLEQKDATPEKIKQTVDEMIEQKSQFLAAAKKLTHEIPTNGAKRMVDELVTTIAA